MNPIELKQNAEASIEKAKEIILKSIPNDEIASIYVKGSFVQDEMVPDSDVDLVVILRGETHLQDVYELTKKYGETVYPPFQAVAYTMDELRTGEKAASRTKSTTSVSRFVKHLDALPLIYGTRPEGQLFARSDEKDLSVNINNFNNLYIPEYKEGKFSFRELVKQVFWLAEAEQRAKGIVQGYSWQALADSVDDSDHLIHLALKYRRQDKDSISQREKDDFLHKLEEYLDDLSKDSRKRC